MQSRKKPKLDINYCTVQQLRGISGIDAPLIESIIRYRRRQFLESVNDLANLNGMTISKLNILRDHFNVLYQKQAMPSALIARMNTPMPRPSGLSSTNDYYEKSLSMLSSAKLHDDIKHKLHERTGSARNGSQHHLLVHTKLHEKPGNKFASAKRPAKGAVGSGGQLTLHKDTVTYSSEPQHAASVDGRNRRVQSGAFSSQPAIHLQKSSSGNNMQFSCTFNKKEDTRAVNKSNNASNVSECSVAFHRRPTRQGTVDNCVGHLRVKSANVNRSRNTKSATKHKAYVDTIHVYQVQTKPDNNINISKATKVRSKQSQLFQENLKQHNLDHVHDHSVKRSLIETWVTTVNTARKTRETDLESDYVIDDMENVSAANRGKLACSAGTLTSYAVIDGRKSYSPTHGTEKSNLTKSNGQNAYSGIDPCGKDTNTTKSLTTKLTSQKYTNAATVNKTDQDKFEPNINKPTVAVHHIDKLSDRMSDSKCITRKVQFASNCGPGPSNYHPYTFSKSTSKAIATYNSASQVAMMGPCRFLTCNKLFNTLPTSVFGKAPHVENFNCHKATRREQIYTDKRNAMPAYSFTKKSNKTLATPHIKYPSDPPQYQYQRTNDPQKYLRPASVTPSRIPAFRNVRHHSVPKNIRDSCRVM